MNKGVAFPRWQKDAGRGDTHSPGEVSWKKVVSRPDYLLRA
jgi:hypothetical protein